MTETTSIKLINPFNDITPQVYAESNNVNDFSAISIGGFGDNGLKADKSGMWFGSRKFADAPFKVDMSGNLTANSVSITGGIVKYGKVSFTDVSHAGYYLGPEGIYFGTAADGKKIKFDIAAGTFVISGITLSWGDVSGTGKPADNATVGATFGVNIAGGSTGSNYVNNNGYITTITGNSITTGTITVGSSSVGLTVNSGGDILMNSEDGYSFSSILFRRGSSGWSMSYVGTGGGGYNSGELLIEPQDNGQTFSIGSYGLTTVGIYTHLAVYGDVYVSGSSSFGSIRPRSNSTYNCGSSSYLWANVYTLNLSLAGGNYINYTGGFIQSNSQFRVVGSINITGNITLENYASFTVKDSGGTSRTLTCQYNSTLGKYILST